MDTVTVLVIVAVILILLKAKDTLVPSTFKVSEAELRIFLKRIEPYEKHIEKYGDPDWRACVSPNLIRAMIWTESSGHKHATRVEWNDEISRGLMQLTVPAAKDVGFKGMAPWLLDPKTNIKFGSAYLWKLFQDFGGAGVESAILDAISAYNAGATTVTTRKAAGQGYNNPEYVARVMSYYNALEGAG